MLKTAAKTVERRVISVDTIVRMFERGSDCLYPVQWTRHIAIDIQYTACNGTVIEAILNQKRKLHRDIGINC